MPGALVKGHELQQFAIAPYQQMRGNPQLMDFPEIGMLIRIQAIAKQLLDEFPAKLLRWQADAVNYQQGNVVR